MLKSFGVPNGIRTRVAALKGRCPRPLDDGDISHNMIFTAFLCSFQEKNIEITKKVEDLVNFLKKRLQKNAVFQNSYHSVRCAEPRMNILGPIENDFQGRLSFRWFLCDNGNIPTPRRSF